MAWSDVFPMLESHVLSVALDGIVIWDDIKSEVGNEEAEFARTRRAFLWPIPEGSYITPRIVWQFSTGFLVMSGANVDATFAIRGPFDAKTSARDQLVARILNDDPVASRRDSIAKLVGGCV